MTKASALADIMPKEEGKKKKLTMTQVCTYKSNCRSAKSRLSKSKTLQQAKNTTITGEN